MPVVRRFQTPKSKDYWVARLDGERSIKEQVERASILIVPIEGSEERGEPLFPENTLSLFRYMRQGRPPGVEVELAVADEDYVEIARHHVDIDLGQIVIEMVKVAATAPILVLSALLINYISEHYLKRNENPKGNTLKLSITQGNSSVTIEGPADEVRSVLFGIHERATAELLLDKVPDITGLLEDDVE